MVGEDAPRVRRRAIGDHQGSLRGALRKPPTTRTVCHASAAPIRFLYSTNELERPTVDAKSTVRARFDSHYGQLAQDAKRGRAERSMDFSVGVISDVILKQEVFRT